MKAIRRVFADNKIDPKFAYIIVSKRVNSRFFKVAGQSADNPPSGTVVDDVVTLPERQDKTLMFMPSSGFLLHVITDNL